ncbi:MAG: hypothetical protein KDA76_06115 [Planctomycetaceae bacterium]|nr:hypothetical protein [Planctomycetaceae bacterium]
MNANVSRVPPPGVWISLIACGFTLGCHQPYSPSPYQQPGMFGQPYGQPMPYGQPAPYGQPQGPAQFAPGVSSVPSESIYAPRPANPSGGGGDAPAFGNPPVSSPNGNTNGNSVPKYNDPTSSDSPYFEQGSLRQQSFVPQIARVPTSSEQSLDNGVAAAGFSQPESTVATIDLTGNEQFAEFEPPVVVESPRAGESNSSSAMSAENGVPGVFATAQEPRPMPGQFELAAPPVDDVPFSGGDALEGQVRFLSATKTWVLTFAADESGNAPFGGELPLTGKPGVLQVLRDGTRYRLGGYLEAPEGNVTRSQFHVLKAEPIGSPFAQP